MAGTGKRGVLPVAEVVEALHSRGGQAVGEGTDHSSRPSQVVGLEGAFAGTVSGITRTPLISFVFLSILFTELRAFDSDGSCSRTRARPSGYSDAALIRNDACRTMP